jgi:hypothetical protein
VTAMGAFVAVKNFEAQPICINTVPAAASGTK